VHPGSQGNTLRLLEDNIVTILTVKLTLKYDIKSANYKEKTDKLEKISSVDTIKRLKREPM
jgi:hypothetical protein